MFFKAINNWGAQKIIIYFPIFYLVKSSEDILFFVFFTCHGPEKGSKYHLETVQTTFSDINGLIQ